MRVGESMKKGLTVAFQSLHLALVILVINLTFNLAMTPLTLKLQKSADWVPNPTAAQVLPAMPYVGLFVLFMILLGSLVTAGSLSFIQDKIKLGHAALLTFFSSGAKFFFRFFLLTLLSFLLGLVFFLLILLSIFLSAFISSLGGNAGAMMVIGVILEIVFILGIVGAAVYFMFLLFTLAPFSIVAKNHGPLAAMKESMVLVKKNFWSVVGLVALLSLVFIAFAIFALIIGFIANSATGGNAATSANPTQMLAQQGPIQLTLSVIFGFLFLLVDIFSKSSLMNFYLGSTNSNNTGGA